MLRWIAVCVLCLMLAIILHAQDADPYAIALRRIEAARESNDKSLDLSFSDLNAVPLEIGQLTNLQQLDLSNNQLTTLPSEIGQLTNLQRLYLDDNQLTNLPPQIGQLTNLEELVLHHNRLTTVPNEIGLLNKLCLLNLSANRLRHLPTTIGNLNFLGQQNEACPVVRVISGTKVPYPHGLILEGNPLVSPPREVVEQGTGAVLAYLRNQAWYHMQRLIIGAAGGVGLFALLLLGFRWKQRGGRKAKQKRG